MYLLDTDTLSYAVRGDGDVLDRFLDAGPTPCFISALTWYELLFGIERSARRPTLLAGLETIRELIIALDVDARVAEAAAVIRAEAAASGRVAGPIDPLIAGTARVHDLVLVTHNTRHFEHIPGLRLEDWK